MLARPAVVSTRVGKSTTNFSTDFMSAQNCLHRPSRSFLAHALARNSDSLAMQRFKVSLKSARFCIMSRAKTPSLNELEFFHAKKARRDAHSVRAHVSSTLERCAG